ncbi:alanine racemase [Aliifodinibius salipaludis]|uniref:Alanine racemase n=1 Tax=Fodinibius salipaludis TaxID=2032627 RepID=A0A2A2G9L0_9BACT|nr:alanine racemase [Aliifodinibius salipaludis]PAU93543.1 alanine racemase [Aliifodinibius salipaludis]
MSNELYPSWIELSKQAFEKNISFLKDYIGKDVVFSSVIKGNAYGHGIGHFVPMAEECGVRHFSVFSSDEARQAARASTEEDTHIMIMGMINNGALGWAIERNISFFIFELDRLKFAVKEAQRIGKPARIHLHLETGMNRVGLEKDQFEEAVDIIRNNHKHLQIDGICTHYAGAESVGNYVRIQKQIENFKEYSSWFEDQGIEARHRHTACSASALNYPETIMDIVRFGIAQYGFWPNRETYMNFVKKYPDINKEHKDPLERVLSWKSHVMSTKEVPAGEFVGYGNTYLTGRDETIATVPIGYSHGFGRNLTNVGIVLINGKRAPVAGLVNMNLLTVDVTDIPNVKKGDEVVIIGHQGEQEITVSSFSEMRNNMNYEVLVQIPSRIPRSIV